MRFYLDIKIPLRDRSPSHSMRSKVNARKLNPSWRSLVVECCGLWFCGGLAKVRLPASWGRNVKVLKAQAQHSRISSKSKSLGCEIRMSERFTTSLAALHCLLNSTLLYIVTCTVRTWDCLQSRGQGYISAPNFSAFMSKSGSLAANAAFSQRRIPGLLCLWIWKKRMDFQNSSCPCSSGLDVACWKLLKYTHLKCAIPVNWIH